MKTKDLTETEIKRMEKLDTELSSPSPDVTEDDIKFYNENRMNMYYYHQEQADMWLHHTNDIIVKP